ncbi:MarR family transcriptional regulator [Chryseomicrobium sp. FSL W7-1435]|uniref:MarR family winged helix-turn-helix transcriptional regulator n=1 Tax=Chryseomicrobium sp. FSL W7-1435 TaxID=2921704 RepID=UPI003159A6CF
MDTKQVGLAIEALVRTSGAFHQRIKEDAVKNELHVTEFSVLELLYHQGRQPVQKVAKHVLITSGSTTYVLDKLVKKQLITRTVCTEDRRITYIELSASGQQLMEQAFPEHLERMSQYFTGIEEEEFKQWLEITRKLGKAARKGD